MKEGTGRGAGGSYRETATFSWEEGAAVPACVVVCWGKVGAVHRTQAGTALGAELGGCGACWPTRGAQSGAPQAKSPS